MQTSLVFSLVISFFCFFASDSKALGKNHFLDLISNFPYGLLSDDYGILSLNDLALNASKALPIPFNSKSTDNNPYQYWQCFENKNISFFCDSNGKKEKYEGVMGLIVIKINTHSNLQTYSEHRLWPIKDCRRFNKDAKVLLNRVKHVCFSGSFISQEINSMGITQINWSFERIKTKNGCEGRGCEIIEESKKVISSKE